MHQNNRTSQKHLQAEALSDWDHPSAPPSHNGEPTAAARLREQAIRELAYAKWELAGQPAGDGVKFWVDAERELSG